MQLKKTALVTEDIFWQNASSYRGEYGVKGDNSGEKEYEDG